MKYLKDEISGSSLNKLLLKGGSRLHPSARSVSWTKIETRVYEYWRLPTRG
jgi:hypothetical protein